jgi:hypothetical protein
MLFYFRGFQGGVFSAVHRHVVLGSSLGSAGYEV